MPTSIDELYIEINANAVRANDAIDRLVGKLDRLSISLGKINSSGLNGLANGVQRLGTSMQAINNVKTADVAKLATGISQLATLNHSQIKTSALAITTFGNAVKKLSAISGTSVAIGTMAGNIAKLGSKSGTQAIANIPMLTTALNNLFVTLSRAPTVNKNIVDMTNALANLASQGSRVRVASSAMVGGFSRTSNSVKTTRKHFLSLASAFGRFYASYFLVIRGLKGLWKSIESTADYIEAFNYYNVAFGKIASEWDKDWEKYGYENGEIYAESFTQRMDETLQKLSGLQVDQQAGLLNETGLKNLGLNIQEVTQYASQLASVTNSIGQTGETTVAISTSFTKLAGDISSLFNVDFQTVSKNLQSGLIGQSRALYRYGIDITNATLQTRAYELGIEKSVSEMTQMEKQQLRVIEILEQSKVSWGDLANTINSPSNMIRQFKNNLKETGIVLGQLFIPVLERTLPAINGFTIALKRMFVSIAQVLGIKINFDAFGQGYSEMEDDVDSLTDSLDELEESAKEAKAGLRGFDELKLINLGSGSSANEGLESTIDLTQEIIDATKEYEETWNKAFEEMENKAIGFADSIEETFKPLATRIKALLLNIKLGRNFFVGKDVSEITAEITDLFTKAIENVDWENLAGEAVDLFLGVDWAALFESAIDAQMSIEGGIRKFAKGLIFKIIDLFKGEAKTYKPDASTVKELADKYVDWFITSPTTALFTPLKPLVALGQMITDGLTAYMESGSAEEGVRTAIETLIGWFAIIFAEDEDKMLGAFNDFWDDSIAPWFTKEKWSELGEGIKDGLAEAFENAINEVKRLWNDFATWIEDNTFFDLPQFEISTVLGGGGKRRGVDLFATGGFPTKGDLFFANEMGPELIGTMNGKTAVASNGEITGISDAIYNTGQTEANLLQTAVGLLQVIAEKEYGITDSQIGESARRYARDYHARTGDYAFV